MPAIHFRVTAAAALLFAGVRLAGCGGGDGKAGGPVEVVLWEMMDPQERVLLEEHLATFAAAHPDVKVTTAHFGVEDVRNQFLTAALGGGGPDVVYGPSDQAGPFSVAGTLRPLDEVFGDGFFQRFHPLTTGRLGGHHWAVPEQFGNHLVLVCNTALVPEPPKNTDEFIAMAKANTIDENGDGVMDRYGLVFETKEPFWLVPWLGGFGGWVMDETSAPTLDTEAMASALAFVRDLKAKHKVLPKDCDYELADTLFREGRAAMTINGPWSWAGYRDAGVSIRLASIPQVTATGLWPSPMVSYRGYSISRSCPDGKLPAAKVLIEYLTGPEVQAAYASRLGSLPSLLSLQGDTIEADPILAPSMEQVRRGRPMPIVVEMRAIWDAMRPSFQNVMNGESSPADAARAMQQLAVRKIAEMRG
jgi:maltose-binding protein MalE